ncbi:MAG: HAD family hydrolase [Candidatus Riflebacteria bacterium]|nr:HAD family hydrolase [Candidatus Riflebacteria bacterium]
MAHPISRDSTPPRRWTGIFFDVGGTLLYPDPVVIGDHLEGILGRGLPEDRVFAAIQFGSVAIDQAIAQGQSIERWWHLFFGSVLCHLGFDGAATRSRLDALVSDLRACHEKKNLWSYLLPSTHGVLETLQGKGFHLGVISNSDGKVRGQLEEAGLAPFFPFILDSHVVGCEKPDPAIFRLALQESGLPASEVLYIGDIVAIDAVGATGVGMSALILDPLRLRAGAAVPTIAGLADLPAWLESQKGA